MKKKALLLGSLTACFMLSGTAYPQDFCTEKHAKEFLPKVIFSNVPVAQPEMIETLKKQLQIENIQLVNLGEVRLCEAVFYIKPLPGPAQNTMPPFKNIVYFGKDFAIFGEIKKLENGNVVSLTREKAEKLNKEYFEYIKKVSEEANKPQKATLSKEEYEKLKEKADVKLTKAAKVDAVMFASPTCPHCAKMKDVLMKKVNEGKLNLYVVFTPLSPFDEKVSSSVICEKKSDSEKLKDFSNKFSVEKPCEDGMKKVQENFSEFRKVNGRGVPLTFFKINGEIKVIEGERPENVIDGFLRAK